MTNPSTMSDAEKTKETDLVVASGDERSKVGSYAGSYVSENESLGPDISEDEQRLLQEPVDRELVINLGAGAGSAKKSRTPRSRSGKPVDPKCLEPFKYGWRRELVHRGSVHGDLLDQAGHSGPADVYYYTPTGKKLRSNVQIEAYLIESGDTKLSVEHFTFRKTLIGGDESQEVRRFATANRVKQSPGGTPKGSPPKGMPKIALGGSAAKRGHGKGSFDGVSRSFISSASESDSDAPARKRKKVLTPGQSPRSLSQERIIDKNMPAPTQNGSGKKVCGMQCPGMGNIAPSLQCEKCQMLFHQSCANYVGTAPFTCSGCKSFAANSAINPIQTTTLAKPPPVTKVDLSKIIKANEVTGQLLTLPPSVLSHLDTKKHLSLRVDDKILLIPPNCFISSGMSMKVFLPPGTLPKDLFSQPNQPVNFNFQSKQSKQVLNFSIGKPVGKKIENKENEAMSLNKKQAKATESECPIKRLHTGYDCMLRIFTYLSVADMLRAGQVCRIWRRLASQDCLWRVVKLKDSRVSCWEGAAAAFKRHGTYCLDLRGMLFFTDRNRTWHQFTAILKKLDTIKQIYFGHSPAMMLTGVTDNMTQLEELSAEYITEVLPEAQMWSTNTRLDVGKFANLENLVVIKLRGVCGIQLPAFSFKGGPPALQALTKLKSLVLTTLRDVPASEFTFLASLTNLEELELGDCNAWEAETYMQLKKKKVPTATLR